MNNAIELFIGVKKFASPVCINQFNSITALKSEEVREFSRIIHSYVFRMTSFSRRFSLSWNQAFRSRTVNKSSLSFFRAQIIPMM